VMRANEDAVAIMVCSQPPSVVVERPKKLQRRFHPEPVAERPLLKQFEMFFFDSG